MRLSLTLAACAALALTAACSSKRQEVAVAPPPDQTRADCYTVVLFDEYEVETPGPEVPAEYAAFLGEWRNGAWDGKWCHDLIVTSVSKDGRAELFEMHAPYDPWNQPATAFKRTGQINGDGELRLAYGSEQVSYRVVGDRLVAERSGDLGDLDAQLKRPDETLAGTPVPEPRPTRLAAAN